MKAVVMHERGGPEVLRFEDAPDPVPGFGEVLVRVRAATVNHTDLFHREGRFFIQKPLPHILGMDVAGEIAGLGPGVSDWQVGERVFATFEDLGRARDGAYAEYTTVPVRELRRIPEGLGFEAAASVGLAFLTAWFALFERAKLQAWDRVVVTAATSGVGTSAVQIAKWLGCRVVGTAREATGEKAERLLALGADAVLAAGGQGAVAQVREALGGEATLVVEHVAGSSLQRSVEMLGSHGRIVCIGTLGGDMATVNAMDLIMKNAAIMGSFGVVAPPEVERILGLFARGTFTPVIDRVMPLSQAREAHERIEAREGVGKIVLVP